MGGSGSAGGMNIRDACLARAPLPSATQDVHFRLRARLSSSWGTLCVRLDFTTGERLDAGIWRSEPEPAGDVVARGLPEGPDEDFETLMLVLLGALSAGAALDPARYTLLPTGPASGRRTADRGAAGVRVEIVLPERGNLRMVEWAAMAQLGQIVNGVATCTSHGRPSIIRRSWWWTGAGRWSARPTGTPEPAAQLRV